VNRDHLRGFEKSERQHLRTFTVMLVALDRKNSAAPLRGKGGRNILRGGDAQTNQPLAETVRAAFALGLESGFELRIGDHSAAEKKQAQGHAMKMRQRLVGQA